MKNIRSRKDECQLNSSEVSGTKTSPHYTKNCLVSGHTAWQEFDDKGHAKADMIFSYCLLDNNKYFLHTLWTTLDYNEHIWCSFSRATVRLTHWSLEAPHNLVIIHTGLSFLLPSRSLQQCFIEILFKLWRFISRKYFWKCCLQNIGYFIHHIMC